MKDWVIALREWVFERLDLYFYISLSSFITCTFIFTFYYYN